MTEQTIPKSGVPKRKRLKKTNRGFQIYAEFEDTYGKDVRVQESSAVVPRVWIFLEVEQHEPTGEWLAGAHLNKRQAKQVIRALQAWLWHQFREGRD